MCQEIKVIPAGRFGPEHAILGLTVSFRRNHLSRKSPFEVGLARKGLYPNITILSDSLLCHTSSSYQEATLVTPCLQCLKRASMEY
jgi:hypothetical protein